jgi:TRAP-type C4-dicarboxylate transport system permease small subunit
MVKSIFEYLIGVFLGALLLAVFINLAALYLLGDLIDFISNSSQATYTTRVLHVVASRIRRKS